MIKNKAISDFRASISILEANIGLFHSGKREMYRVVAVELRKLLCDGNSSLLPRICSDLELLPINSTIYKLNKVKTGKSSPHPRRIIMQVPGTLVLGGNKGSRIYDVVDPHGELIPLKEWLGQPYLNMDTTVLGFIKSIADKESVHSDKEYGSSLGLARSCLLGSDNMHKLSIIALGEYVLLVMQDIDKKIRDKLI